MERDIIIKPILSEKSYETIKDKKYTFMVAKDANKTEIKLEVERKFDVQVEKVNTMNCHGKLKRMGRPINRVNCAKRSSLQWKSSPAKTFLFVLKICWEAISMLKVNLLTMFFFVKNLQVLPKHLGLSK